MLMIACDSDLDMDPILDIPFTMMFSSMTEEEEMPPWPV